MASPYALALRVRAIQAMSAAAESVAEAVADVTHEVLQLSADVLEVVPIAGLQEAARLLVKIWEAVEAVKVSAEDRLLLGSYSLTPV